MRTYSSCYLACRDWFHEFHLSVCGVLALASMLTPLLILHGVHNGVISGLKLRLTQDPAVLVIIPDSVPPGGFPPTFFESAREQRGTRFCIGRTRDVAAELQLQSKNEIFLTVNLEPTGEKDPVLEQANLVPPSIPQSVNNKLFEAVFSHTAAQKLKVEPGEEVGASLTRRLRDGKRERVEFSIRVNGVLPATAYGMDTLFLPLPVLQSIQDYRDGFAVPLFGATGEMPPTVRNYESFRMYAKHLEDVEELHDWFQQQGLETRTKAREIANIRKLDASLQVVVLIIAVTAGIGFVAFMFSSMQAAAKRKEKMLGMLRLLGYSGKSLLLYPITQALLTAALGTIFSFVLYVLVAFGIDMLFLDQSGGMPLCHMEPWHFPTIAGMVFLLSALSAWSSAQKAAQIEPSIVIREI